MTTFFDKIQAKYVLTSTAKDAYNWFKKEGLTLDGAIVSLATSNGIAGFKFHIPKSEQVKFESDITDNYTSLNTSYQDHIALKPIEITVRGLQGEYFYDLHPIENAISTVTSTTGALLSTFAPQITEIVKQNKTKKLISEKQIDLSVKNFLSGGLETEFNLVDMWKVFQNTFKLKSAQTRAFLYFEALWKSRAIFSVETSWKRYDNMAIKSIVPLRDDNADITDFTITFKQMQFAHTQQISLKALGNRAYQLSPIDTKTLTNGEEKGIALSLEGEVA